MPRAASGFDQLVVLAAMLLGAACAALPSVAAAQGAPGSAGESARQDAIGLPTDEEAKNVAGSGGEST